MVTAIATVTGIIVLIPVSLLALILGFDSFDDWNYSRHRARVNAELVKMDLPDTPPDYGTHPRQPDLALPSPDRQWTLVAQWIDVRGYNWGLRNNLTGKIFLRTEKIRPDNWFPPRLHVLWSPDSAYVAVTSEDGVEVAHIHGGEAIDTDVELGVSDWQKKALLNAADLADFEGWYGAHTKALAWESPNELAIETFIDARMKSDGTERAVAAHLTLRFAGERFIAVSKKTDFYESLPTVD